MIKLLLIVIVSASCNAQFENRILADGRPIFLLGGADFIGGNGLVVGNRQAAPNSVLPLPSLIYSPLQSVRTSPLVATAAPQSVAAQVSAPVVTQIGRQVSTPVIAGRTVQIAGSEGITPVSLPQLLQVAHNNEPVVVQVQTQGAEVQVQHQHIPAPPQEIQLTRSEEEPHTVVHEVIRPVIQEIREIIQPYRRVTQQILPVQEEVQNVVSTQDSTANTAQQLPLNVALQPLNLQQLNLQPLNLQPLQIVSQPIFASAPQVFAQQTPQTVVAQQPQVDTVPVASILNKRKYVEYPTKS